MHILVTGAQGCIGAWVVRALLQRDLDVTIYDLDPHPARLALITTPENVSRVRIETGAIEDTARIKELVKDRGITHVVHLAARLMPFCQANPVAGAMANVIGTINVFEAARDAGRSVRVVYASSSAVWGPGESYEQRALSEEDPLKPATHYGVFKHANEESARVFYAVSNISSMGLRPWTVYGVGRDHGLTADPTIAIRAAVLGKPFQIRLTGFMDFQYVEDVAESFVRCLLSSVEGAHVFNLAGDVVRIEDFITMLAEEWPQAKDLITCSGPQVPVAFRMDASKLHKHVSGIPKTDMREGIRKTVALYSQLKSEGRLNEAIPG